MSQLFSRSNDLYLRLTLAGLVILVLAGVAVALGLARSSYVTGQDRVLEQPIPFSHQHHVADIGIDCRYCHQTVEALASAGMPSTQTCMNCHRYLWNDSEMLQPVHRSFRRDEPIRWNRVHDLPDYVYFNHAIHIHGGIGCYSCHGKVGEMPLTWQARPLTMQWCLDCHRNPEQHVRPARFVYEPKPLEQLVAEKPDELKQLRSTLVKKNNLQRRDDCYTCHR